MTQHDQRPLDIDTMRTSAHRLLAGDAEPPTPDELETLTLQLRGHIMLAIPEIAMAAARLPDDDVPRVCALASIAEARMRLSIEAHSSLPAGIAHAQRLARSVNALADHYENLGAPHPARPDETPEHAAYRRMLEHGSACPLCRGVNEAGQNTTASCEIAGRLYESYRNAHRDSVATR
ncbi:DUF6415 family natural product biosynthesis protein [Streptomyces poriticola]|uniref:DUF6415 family natural product biosynthesis protein n=1 Tax=Streptomyces poriticola TaxID=3120506 RepID=UPI002FCE07CA